MERIAEQREFEAQRLKERARQRKIQTTEEKRIARQLLPNYGKKYRGHGRHGGHRVKEDKAKAVAGAERFAGEPLCLG